ncbi:MAG: ABC transporter ATP-binding protein [Pirellulales bacterium]|nr:ABC transporter ATP-binding protein [Pirellulales bacterium]
MVTTKPLIEVHHLSVRFGHQIVLRDVHLTLPRGQTLAIIGESGCGKTVLLKAMIGLIQPTAGEVIFDNQRLTDLNEKELTRQRMRFGFVFQNAALFDSLTVAQNVAFPLRQHQTVAEEDFERIVTARLAEVGLPESVLAKKPAELSGGMRKRVGLARALVMNPEVLLYDEPTTGLDPIMADVINELIMRTRSRYPVTSVVVTHDMNTARKVADRIVMIYPHARLAEDAPQIIFDGQPEMIDRAQDRRVTQFVRGEAGERLMELNEQGLGRNSLGDGEHG